MIGMFSAAWLLGLGLMISDPPDPAQEFIEKMDKAPAGERVPHWDKIKTLMSRVAPQVGESAPDFSLKTLDGKQTISVAQFTGKMPVVLIFGSYT